MKQMKIDLTFITGALGEQLIQGIAETLWNRPEVSFLREPIENILHAAEFKALTVKAFENVNTEDLPEFFDSGFIGMPAVQKHLAEYIVEGENIQIDTLTELYVKRLKSPSEAKDVREHLENYLQKLRDTFATHDTYGPILLARDINAIQKALLDAMNRLFELNVAQQKSLDSIEKSLAESKESHEVFAATVLRILIELKGTKTRATKQRIFISYQRKS